MSASIQQKDDGVAKHPRLYQFVMALRDAGMDYHHLVQEGYEFAKKQIYEDRISAQRYPIQETEVMLEAAHMVRRVSDAMGLAGVLVAENSCRDVSRDYVEGSKE